jgi:hypothetical protein
MIEFSSNSSNLETKIDDCDFVQSDQARLRVPVPPWFNFSRISKQNRHPEQAKVIGARLALR